MLASMPWKEVLTMANSTPAETTLLMRRGSLLSANWRDRHQDGKKGRQRQDDTRSKTRTG
jgi:hypothetical protein